MSNSPRSLPWPSFEDHPGQKRALRQRLIGAWLGALGWHLLIGFSFPIWFCLNPKEPPPPHVLTVELEHFLEPNPNVPTHEPDAAQAVAHKSQEAAQEKPSDQPLGGLPTLDGEFADSQTIVEASRQDAIPPSVQWLEPVVEERSRSAHLPQKSSPPDIEETAKLLTVPEEPLALAGEGVRVECVPPEALERDKNEPIQITVAVEEIVENPSTEGHPPQPLMLSQRPSPQPRPRLSAKALQAPIKKTQTHVQSLGLIAIDAKWSLFGAYQQQVLEAISLQWQLLAGHLKSVEKDKRSEVVIEFHLNPDGRVESLKVLKTTASRPATLVCQDAIQSREPFGVWPEEMVKLFGKEKRVCIHFFYR